MLEKKILFGITFKDSSEDISALFFQKYEQRIYKNISKMWSTKLGSQIGMFWWHLSKKKQNWSIMMSE